MEHIQNLFRIDFSYVFISVLLILFGMKSLSEIFQWICSKSGLEFQWMRKHKEEQKIIFDTVNQLTELQKKQEEDRNQSILHDQAIKQDLEKLTHMFIDKQIDDLRWEILDFASALSAGRNYRKEQFDHVLNLYNKYEQILEENNLSNGQVTTSMEVIHEVYKEKMKHGFSS